MRSLALVFAVLLLASGAPNAAAGRGEPVRDWIVQLRDGASVEGALTRARDRHGLRPQRSFRHVMRGYSARMTESQRLALLADPIVAAVLPDNRVELESTPQQVPNGVSRVGADPSAVHTLDGSDPVLDVDIAIIDTGIQANHPDLNVAGGYNCTSANTGAWGDEHSHGTHVAGIAAARDNGFGVVGVAPGARVWSVKVLDAQGSGLLSWLLCGLDWVAARRDPVNNSLPLFEVANMSLAFSSSDDGNCGQRPNPSALDLFHQAICRVNRAGVVNAVAAGNQKIDASNRVPAAYGEVLTVGAICDSDGRSGGNGPACDSYADDSWGTFSNYGAAVDFVAPGVRVLSTWTGNGYGYKWGTSMATPHVAGGAALYFVREAQLGRPRPTPEDVRAGLLSAASTNWRQGTYPLGAPKAPPLLDVSTLNLPAGFRIGTTPSSRRAGPSETVFFDVWLGRTGGFRGAVNLSLSGAPPGSSWSVSGSPTIPSPNGSWRRVTVQLPASGATAAYDLIVTASADRLPAQTSSVRLNFDGSYVAANVPRLNLRKVTVSGYALPAVVRWPKVSGATQYELQVSRDEGIWSVLARKSGLIKNTTVWPGARYRYRVRALRNGSWGAWQTSHAYVATPHMPQDGPAQLSGAWSLANVSKSYSEIVSHSSQRGAKLRFVFTGRSVSWIASRGPTRGKANVYIDGTRVATIDLYASKVLHRRTVYRKSWSVPGVHRIEIEVLGTSGRPRVDVDAIAYISTD